MLFQSDAPDYLDEVLDWDNSGVDEDVNIAEHMLEWNRRLAPYLGLKDMDISDIKETYPSITTEVNQLVRT